MKHESSGCRWTRFWIICHLSWRPWTCSVHLLPCDASWVIRDSPFWSFHWPVVFLILGPNSGATDWNCEGWLNKLKQPPPQIAPLHPGFTVYRGGRFSVKDPLQLCFETYSHTSYLMGFGAKEFFSKIQNVWLYKYLEILPTRNKM